MIRFLLLTFILQLVLMPLHSQEVRLGLPEGHNVPVHNAIYSPDGKYIVSYDEQHVIIWNAKLGKAIGKFNPFNEYIEKIQFSQNSKTLLIVASNSFMLIEVISGKIITESKNWLFYINAELCADNKHVLLVLHSSIPSKKSKIVLFNIESGNYNTLVRDSDTEITAEFCHLHNKVLGVLPKKNTIKLWDIPNTNSDISIKNLKNNVNTAKVSPDGKYLIVVYNDASIQIWDIEDKKLVLENNTADLNLKYCSLSNDNSKFVIARENSAVFYDMQNIKDTFYIDGDFSNLNELCFLKDNNTIVFCFDDGEVECWDFSEKIKLRTFKVQLEGPYIRYSINVNIGLVITSGSNDRSPKIWDLNTGKLLNTLVGHSDFIESMNFSNDNKFLVTTSADSKIIIWDLRTGEKLQSLSTKITPIGWNAYQSELRNIFVIASDTNNLISIRNLRNGNIFKPNTKIAPSYNTKSYDWELSSDYRRLLIYSQDESNIIELWDVFSGVLIATISGEEQSFQFAGFSKDDKLLVTVGKVCNNEDINTLNCNFISCIKIWDALTGEFLFKLPNINYTIEFVDFIQNNKALITSSIILPENWTTG
ncbi:MAG TPA: WD40 repeat domain-containing protein [Prolixibacteraceae bacterium]|nr:WD40 repeat domain-containing protein [Prolixibacteraceae bacterium]